MINTREYKQKLLSGVYNFEEMASWAFKYQYLYNPIYQQFCNHLNRTPETVNKFTDFPFLPIEFFKTQKIVSNEHNSFKVFESSGTTGSTTSKHYVVDEGFYHTNCEQIFYDFYGNTTDHALFFLLPSYLERENSSLVSMAQHLLRNNRNPLSGFYLNNYPELQTQLRKAIKNKDKIILLGVTFGLLDLVDSLKEPISYSDLVIMETGGMKGRRKELVRDEVHKLLLQKLKCTTIHSEYGMTELLSQVYSDGKGVFKQNNRIKLLVRELQDPLEIKMSGKGGLNVIDLANIDSVSFIATQDQGEIMPNLDFKVTGRIDHSDIRGCNLMSV